MTNETSYRYVIGKGSRKKPVHLVDNDGRTYCQSIENTQHPSKSEFSNTMIPGRKICVNCADLRAKHLAYLQSKSAQLEEDRSEYNRALGGTKMSDMGYALKVQFGGGSKLYEYFLPPEIHLSHKYLKDYINSGHCRAVVDARGEPKLVKVIDVVPYEDRMFDGDLKPVIVLFDGVVLWEQPERPRQPRERVFDPKLGDLDDEIPF